jgi:hypothetical protein
VLIPVVLSHLAETDDLAEDFAIKPSGLGLRVDVLDVVRDTLLLLFETLDALD